MFDFFRKHMRVLQFILVLLILPSFVVFGIQGYNRFNDESNQPVAKVDGHGITQAEWDNAQREQLQRAQQQNPGLDAKLFDTPRARQLALDNLVRDRVLLTSATDANLAVSDERLRRLFLTDPQFAALRNPDGSVNKDFLAMQGMSSQGFAQRLRQELALRQVVQGVSGTVFATPAEADASLDALFQRREVQLHRFEAKDYLAKVTPGDADIEAYYKDPKHADEFKAPEQADIEYVVFDAAALGAGLNVSEDDARKYYAENEKRYTTPEERRVSHILISAAKDAPQADKDKAKAKAQELLAQLKKTPASFAEIAKKDSQDPGSAEKGGDLDWISAGMMVKPFEDAAFALKPNELSDVVQSDYGFHIIKVTDVRGGQKRSFEAVRPEIEAEIKKQLAQKAFSDGATDFTNMVYEQPDGLKPVADRFKLTVKTATGVTRTPAPGATGPLASPKLLESLFGGDTLRNKRNTDAVETGPSQLTSGRVVKYSPAHMIPLAEVKDKVRQRVAATQAAALARKDGEARLAELKKDPKLAIDGAPVVIARNAAGTQPRPLIDAVMQADAAKLPVPLGVDLGDAGYAVARITQVLPRDPASMKPDMAGQYANAWGEAEALAYYNALKSRYKVELKGAAAANAASAAAETAALLKANN